MFIGIEITSSLEMSHRLSLHHISPKSQIAFHVITCKRNAGKKREEKKVKPGKRRLKKT
jgi:hypothetical protein